MNYIVFALLSAFFAALTSILAKIGMKNINSNLATALRTVIVVIFSWLMASISTDIFSEFSRLSLQNGLFLILSGITTGVSWLCFFRALKTGNINVVIPIDKSSIIFTIILSSVILGEGFGPLKALCTLLIAAGTLLMLEKRAVGRSEAKKSALGYAFAGAIFAALTSVLGKIGISGISSSFGSAVRTVVVLIMAWIIVFATKSHKSGRRIGTKASLSLVFSGIATGASWLCYYHALSIGPASIVAPIDKLSIAFTVLLSYIFFREKLSFKSFIGLLLIISGTLLLLIC